MVFSRYRVRSTLRDNENDRRRVRKITDLIDAQVSEMEKEKAGLSKRYCSTIMDASYCLENLGGSENAKVRALELESFVMYCETRVNNIEIFIEKLKELKANLSKSPDQ